MRHTPNIPDGETMLAASPKNGAISLEYVRFVGSTLLFLVYSMAALAQDGIGPDASLEGRMIVSIVADPPQQPMVDAEFDRRLGLHIGSALSLAEVRAAIDSLYRTGRYDDVSIEAQPSGAGVELKVVTTFNYFVTGVNIEGAADLQPRAVAHRH